jgi:disulfide bond formation protein DsbB
MKNFVKNNYIYLSWIVALISMGGSLYFSEVMLFEPCRLCWYQRILMYPLAFFLGKAAYTNDKRITGYVTPLSIIGACIALFHYGEQKLPWLADIAPCKVGIPCSGEYINWLGFITIPLLAFIGFTLISTLLILGSRLNKEA